MLVMTDGAIKGNCLYVLSDTGTGFGFGFEGTLLMGQTDLPPLNAFSMRLCFTPQLITPRQTTQ